LSQVTFGSSFELKEQQDCCLIGNNDCEEYSIKFGVVTSLTINRGEVHSFCFQTSFDRTGGSSGSPVFDVHGKVVGIHMSGTDTTSIELRIEYLKDALKVFQSATEAKVRRGTIGVELGLVRTSSASKHFAYPKDLVEDLKSKWSELKHVLTVERIVPHGAVSDILRPGDIIHSVNGEVIGNNLYLFDKLVDSCTGSQVDLVIYRNGSQMNFKVDVADAESHKITKFALYAGGIFHNLTPVLRSRFNIAGPGVFLTQVTKGSSLSCLGEGSSKHPTSYIVVLEEICGMRTHNVDEFVEAVTKIGSKQHVYALSRNLRSFSSALLAFSLDLDLKFEPLRVFEWSPEKLDWVQKSSTQFTRALGASKESIESYTSTSASNDDSDDLTDSNDSHETDDSDDSP
jgi:hypothetical protein